jgi:hypothetical protein
MAMTKVETNFVRPFAKHPEIIAKFSASIQF